MIQMGGLLSTRWLHARLSQVEANIHRALSSYQAAYGFNAKEVFEIPVPLAPQYV
jgi:hypothetical protein